jgi:hypothetical protein
MSVDMPIQDAVVRRSTRGTWIVGAVVLLLAFGLAATAALRYSPQPDRRNFGTVQTRFGTAGVLCGGGAPGCGQATLLEFPKCTDALRHYFSGGSVDARARALLGKRPPTGSEWYFVCGSPQLIHGAPALLEPN